MFVRACVRACLHVLVQECVCFKPAQTVHPTPSSTVDQQTMTKAVTKMYAAHTHTHTHTHTQHTHTHTHEHTHTHTHTSPMHMHCILRSEGALEQWAMARAIGWGWGQLACLSPFDYSIALIRPRDSGTRWAGKGKAACCFVAVFALLRGAGKRQGSLLYFGSICSYKWAGEKAVDVLFLKKPCSQAPTLNLAWTYLFITIAANFMSAYKLNHSLNCHEQFLHYSLLLLRTLCRHTRLVIHWTVMICLFIIHYYCCEPCVGIQG